MTFQWRRGLLFAAIHVAIVAPLLSWQIALRVATTKTVSSNQTSEILEPPEFQHADSDETTTANVDLCTMTYDPPPMERFVAVTYLPVSILMDPFNPCRAGFNLPKILEPGRTFRPRGYPVAVEI